MSVMGETITLNKREQKRVLVLNQVIAGQIAAEGAAELLGLSERQVWRILAAYRKEGAASLVHGNRGREPVNALESGLRDRVVELAKTKYAGFNHQHLTEKLNEVEEIAVRRSSVRRILLEAGISTPRKRRPPKHRSRRERYPKEGMLLQADGSRHDWLEGRGPYMSLLGPSTMLLGRWPTPCSGSRRTPMATSCCSATLCSPRAVHWRCIGTATASSSPCPRSH